MPSEAAGKSYDLPDDVSAWQIYKRLFGYTRQLRGLFLIAILGMAIYAATDAALMWILEPMMDDGFDKNCPCEDGAESSLSIAMWIPYALFVLMLFRGAGGFLSTYFMAIVGRGVVAQLRTELFAKMAVLPTTNFDREPSAHFMSKFTFDIEQVATATTTAVVTLVRSSLTLVFFIGLMFYQSALLALSIFVLGPIIAVVIGSVSKRFRKIAKRIQKSMGGVNNTVSEAIRGSRELKIYAQHGAASDQFDQLNQQNTRQYARYALVKGGSVLIIQVVGAVAVTFVVAVALSGSMDLSAGEMVSFFGAMLGSLQPLRNLTKVNASIQRAVAAAYSVFSVLDAQSENDQGQATLAQMSTISFENVDFCYDGNESSALSALQLDLQAGQITALVGESGSGKSTIISLLARFYDPTSGCLSIDGRDVRDYTMASYRQQIAYVAQSPMLFNSSIRDNINFGAAEPLSEQRLAEVLEAANLTDVVARLDNGVDTLVGESGALLSGGQRQRVAIARALAKDAPLLLLDEATSALDNESERKVQAALEQLMQGRTTIVVAHRLSTIRNADKVVVMGQGRVVEAGGYDELAAKGGAFAHLLQQNQS